jgi:hypothetical protein
MWHHNVDLLAYHDLDGRSGFKLALQEAGGRFFLYVAGFWHSGCSARLGGAGPAGRSLPGHYSLASVPFAIN